MLKYSLATLFVIMAIVGVGCAAVANYSDVWAEGMVTLSVAVLLLALLVAVHGRPSVRPFASGFAIVGWTYFLLTFVEAAGLRDELLTSRAVDRLYGWKQKASADDPNSGMDGSAGTAGGYGGSGYGAESGEELDDLFAPPEAMSSGMDGYASASGKGGYGYRVSLAALRDAPPVLRDIGHALWTLVFALAGGVAAQAIQRMSRKREGAA